jgi:CHAT domain-containing protein
MRATDKHVDLDELEIWHADSSELSAQLLKRREEITEHLKECSACSDLAETHVMILGQQGSSSSHGPCPDIDAWLKLAAGLVSEQDKDRLLGHAANCEACARVLKEAIAALDTGEPEDEIQSLQSSTESWQVMQARNLHALSKNKGNVIWPVQKMKMRAFPAIKWQVYTLAAAIVLAASLGLWYRSIQSPDTLIAKAYDARRTTDLLLPGTHPVPLYSPGRDIQGIQEWPALLQAKLRAQEALEKNSGSPYWHQVLGRVFILQSDPKSALSEFQLAVTKDQNLKRIQFDLGTAYFELGDESRDSSNYGYAADAFSLFLEKNGDDVSALVDRALCWQRMGIKNLALDDLNRALKDERRADWRKAIQNLIDQTNQLHSDRDSPSLQLPEFGTGDLSWVPDRSDSDNYEEDLGILLQNSHYPLVWENNARIERLVEVGKRHNDAWLIDWLHSPRTRRSIKADRLLAAAVRSNSSGNAEEALGFAAQSRRLYSQTGNQAGEARAELEQIYAFQRMGREKDCLHQSSDGFLRKATSHYSQLQTWLFLEQGACLFSTGSTSTSLEAIEHAIQNAAAAHLPILYERAQGFLAGYYTQKGMTEMGWRADVDGLRFCDRFRCPPVREYQFLADLIDASVALGLKKLSVFFAALSASRASDTGNLQLVAYSLEVLGKRYLDAGEVRQAQQVFSKADKTLSLLGDNSTIRTYRADWVADRSQLLALQGRHDLALANLSSALREIQATQSLMVQINYWSRRALLEDQSRHAVESVGSARNAIGCGDQVLSSIRKPSDRRAWQSNVKLAYLTLVEALLDAGKNEQALKEWEAFRSIADSSMPPSPHTNPSDGIPASWVVSDQDTLVFARLNRRYVRFSMLPRERSVHAVALPIDPDALDQLARTFSLLCADPRSQISEIRALGTQLYRILFLENEDAVGRNLRIEPGPILERLPFGALTTPQGQYLAESSSISLLPEFWTLRTHGAFQPLSQSADLLILHPKYLSLPGLRIPENYDETSELIKRFPNATVTSGNQDLDEISRLLVSTEVFHFVGHASGNDQSSLLLLGYDADHHPVSLSAEFLNGVKLSKCRLIVLAACSTAEGGSRSLQLNFDLPDAFLKAGASHVAATLWPVDSVATKELVLAFYDQLLKGKSYSAALSIAEGQVRTRIEFQHPYFWSGFDIFET